MNSDLKSPKIQQWIQENLHQNVYDLALKKSPFENVAMQELVQQIQGKKIAQKKFPYLFEHNILYPPKLNLEQTSSQTAAEYKANLVNGNVMADVMGGLGIDTIFFSKKFKEVYHLELNEDLQKIAADNFKTLNIEIKSQNQNGITFLENSQRHFDLIYVDPSRRNAHQNKVFLLEDLTPNLLDILPLLQKKSQEIMVKLSPLIDLNYLINTIPQVLEIHLIAIRNEMKEVLIRIKQNVCESPQIICVNLETNQSRFSFQWHEFLTLQTSYTGLKKYVYEPNSAIQKSGGNEILAKTFDLKKLHPNTQLFTSDNLITDFPGRVFEVIQKIKNPKKELKNKSIMAIHRNFPEDLRLLKKRLKFSTDGTYPVIFTQSIEDVIMVFVKSILI